MDGKLNNNKIIGIIAFCWPISIPLMTVLLEEQTSYKSQEETETLGNANNEIDKKQQEIPL